MDKNFTKILENFYKKNPEVLEDMVLSARGREAAYMLHTGHFGKRPYYIDSEEDILNLVKKGALSFHMSVERWYNPLNLSTKLKKRELNELREGWDLLFDIDSKNFEIAKYTAKLVVDVLEDYDIDPIYIKYSGGKGFHIVVPWELFPEEVKFIKKGEEVLELTKNLFPDLARLLAMYIMSVIEDKLLRIIESIWDVEELINTYKLEVLKENFSPYHIVNIDTIAISSRHLFRMPYSINEKTGKLSIPLTKKNILDFDPEIAVITVYSYENIPFLTENIDRKDLVSKLIKDAVAWSIVNEFEKERYKAIYEISKSDSSLEEAHIKRVVKRFKGKVPEEYFPPCIKNILSGVEDGRKRSVFILINFLYNLGWSWDEIKNRIIEWNDKNPDPLRERYIEYQIEWHKQLYSKGNKYLPPNCNNEGYYKDIGVCDPDNICKLIKNPISYPYKKLNLYKKEDNDKNKERRNRG